MFDTSLSGYSITRTSPFGRDLLAELVSALRQRGIRIGFYFSLPDWHHEDYPQMTDATVSKPYRIGDYVRTTPDQWSRYRQFMLGQITELLSNYGRVDVMWFDGEFEHTTEEWDFAGIREHVRALQPDCLVNDRCVGFGDFVTPEQQVPDVAPTEPWEVCLTMNESWGWASDDNRWKSTPTILSRLVETITAGGNLLLNVGPKGDGTFPTEAVGRLADLGTWVSNHRDAVFDLEPVPGKISSPVPLAAKTAEDGTRVYVYCTLRPWDQLTLRAVPVNRVSSVCVMATGEPLAFEAIPSLVDVHSGASDPLGNLEITLPTSIADSVLPVLEIHLLPQS